MSATDLPTSLRSTSSCEVAKNVSERSALHMNQPLQSTIKVREVKCSTLLHVMDFGKRSEEYTANVYRGCVHGCVYCYAPSLIHDEREWGSYVDVKINAPEVLDRELRRAEKRVVFLSSASDPYQPAESRCKVTRRVLEVLLKHGFPVLILTRSPLVLRDLEILKKLPWVRVGFSISSVPDRFYEPLVPPLNARLNALKKLADAGITTWVSMAPVIPQLVLQDMNGLFSKLKEVRVSTVSIGLLRFTGYEESRKMFEQRTGQRAAEASLGGNEVIQKLSGLAKRYEIDTTGAGLAWKDEEKKEVTTLDCFWP
ncbi:MAG: radical SAM protein [Rhabdochlamydiaceae bacterium]